MSERESAGENLSGIKPFAKMYYRRSHLRQLQEGGKKISLLVLYNPSTLFQPSSIEEALSLLKSAGPNARLVAGNTTLYEFARQGALADVDKLIDLMGLGLSYIETDEKENFYRIGATTTFATLANSSVLKNNPSIASLPETAGKITPPQIRNMGTIGGAACSGIPFYDMPVTLLALDVKMKVFSAALSEERIVRADDFFVGYFVTALSSEDLLVEIQVPISDAKSSGSAFVKLGRTSIDFAVVNSSVKISLDDSQRTITDARIAIGAIAPTPIRAKISEETLKGREVSDDLILKAAKCALEGVDEPTPSVHASASYKRKVTPIVVRDALYAALDRARAR